MDEKVFPTANVTNPAPMTVAAEAAVSRFATNIVHNLTRPRSIHEHRVNFQRPNPGVVRIWKIALKEIRWTQQEMDARIHAAKLSLTELTDGKSPESWDNYRWKEFDGEFVNELRVSPPDEWTLHDFVEIVMMRVAIALASTTINLDRVYKCRENDGQTMAIMIEASPPWDDPRDKEEDC